MIQRSRKCWIEILKSRYVTAADPSTVAVLPDTQFYSESFPGIYNAQTDWIVSQREARNIVFATSRTEASSLSFQNLINAQRGINGLLFEIAGLPSLNITTEDFLFRVSPLGTFDSNAWTPNRWLQIQVLPTLRNGLLEKKTFYIGHLLGETTGLSQQDTYAVQVTDVVKIRAEVGKTATVGSLLDVNKNGIIEISDITSFRTSVGSLVLSNLTIPPKGSVAEGEGRVQSHKFVSHQSQRSNRYLYKSYPNTEELSKLRTLRSLSSALVDSASSGPQIDRWLLNQNQE